MRLLQLILLVQNRRQPRFHAPDVSEVRHAARPRQVQGLAHQVRGRLQMPLHAIDGGQVMHSHQNRPDIVQGGAPAGDFRGMPSRLVPGGPARATHSRGPHSTTDRAQTSSSVKIRAASPAVSSARSEYPVMSAANAPQRGYVAADAAALPLAHAGDKGNLFRLAQERLDRGDLPAEPQRPRLLDPEPGSLTHQRFRQQVDPAPAMSPTRRASSAPACSVPRSAPRVRHRRRPAHG